MQSTQRDRSLEDWRNSRLTVAAPDLNGLTEEGSTGVKIEDEADPL